MEVHADTPAYVHGLVQRGKGDAELLEPAEQRAEITALAREVGPLHASGGRPGKVGGWVLMLFRLPSTPEPARASPDFPAP